MACYFAKTPQAGYEEAIERVTDEMKKEIEGL